MTEGKEAGIVIYTVGHSTRSLEEFLALLNHHGIQTLADIRSLPGSRKFPHFDKENLEKVLPGHEVAYVWLRSLGGLRRVRKGFESPNAGLNSPALRAYADHMAGDEFRGGVQELLHVASGSVTTVMCAEAVYWRCHRRLLSDYLLAQGVEVRHIMGVKSLRLHRMSEEAMITSQKTVIYPKGQPSL